MRNKLVAIMLMFVLLGCDSNDKKQPPELTQHNKNMLAYYANLEYQTEGDYVTFWGDSFIQSLLVDNIATSAINLGIGTETSYGLLERLKHTPNLIKHSKAIFIHTGINDLKYQIPTEVTLSNIQQAIQIIRTHTTAPIYLNQLFPVDESKTKQKSFKNKKIIQINKLLTERLSRIKKLTLISTENFFKNGQLPTNLHRGDGVHLSPTGYAKWTALLKKTLVL